MGAMVLPKVIDDLKDRDAKGRKEYGCSLHTDNGRNALQDAYEEALDLSIYLKQALMERTQLLTEIRERMSEPSGLSVPMDVRLWCIAIIDEFMATEPDESEG